MIKRESDIQRILIIRPSSIGDIVMASPMLSALKQGYPEARISWLVDPSAIDLLRWNPLLDEVIPWDKNRWKRLWKKGRLLAFLGEVIRFSREMRARHFDLTLDAQGLLRSRILARLSHARTRVGFESKEPGRFLMTRIISRGPSNKQMGSEYAYMMRELGIPSSPFAPNLVLSDKDLMAGQQVINQTGIKKKYAVFCPFTTRPQKHWGRERWGGLAKEIHEKLDLPGVLLGGPNDRSEASAIHATAPHELIDLTGRLSLAVSAAIISKSALAIGVDTGLTHMAIAFHCPTVALFGATCPYLSSENQRALVLYNKMPCSPCKRNPTCNGEYTCMKKIGIENVLEAALRVTKNG
ncbi:MAG: glycosyltransferase family 9 protein [Deltaproteobacteria bacterium]|nr:glycosyltransferase family 9 protein [Deltaproteobacteria bacterium]